MEDDGLCHQDGDHDDHDDELCVEIMIMMTNNEKLLTFLKWLKILWSLQGGGRRPLPPEDLDDGHDGYEMLVETMTPTVPMTSFLIFLQGGGR